MLTLLSRKIYLFLALLAHQLCSCSAYDIELCNTQNQGDCECRDGDTKTYVFTPGQYQRCIHAFVPASTAPLPVLISIDGYGQGYIPPFSRDADAAKYYGYAVLGIGSTGPKDGAGGFGLEFPANGVVNPSNPTPCSATDSREYAYIEGVLEWIAGNSDLDASKVYLEGFSQSSMFAAYASVCFADRIAGLWQGGSGLAKTFHTPVTPGWQGQCTQSDYAEHGNSCCNANFCTDCTYWPIYPRTCEHKLVDCIASYTNDNIACGSDMYMYEAMAAEGNDARMLSFAPNGDTGGHRNPENAQSWIVGCLGIVDSCSSACETSFLSCIQSNNADEFARCEGEIAAGNLANCAVGCAPTLDMLKTSETPVVNLSDGKFGTQTGLSVADPPTEPNCDLGFGRFDDPGRINNKCNPPSGSGPATGELESCESTPTTPTAPTPTAPTPTAPTPTAPTPTAPTPTAPTPTAPTPTAPTPTAPTPTAPSPPTTTSCKDSRARFKTKIGQRAIWRNCVWVENNPSRCQYVNVSGHCANSCGTCDICADSGARFVVFKEGKKLRRNCKWVNRRGYRCTLNGMYETCRESCNACQN